MIPHTFSQRNEILVNAYNFFYYTYLYLFLKSETFPINLNSFGVHDSVYSNPPVSTIHGK